jgi:plastocyanin
MLDFGVSEKDQLRPALALFVVTGLASPMGAAAGTVRGRVQLVEKSGRTAVDLTDVVVYVEGPKLKAPPAKVTMTMKGKSFTPHVAVVAVGGTVEFPNEDPILHNVFSVSGENRFDLDLYKRPKSGSWTFQHPGVVRVYCNIHPQMSAVILVRDNPWFTKATQDGAFELADLPAGRYVLRAWHERGGEAEKEITVTAKSDSTVQLALDASGYKRLPHKNKFGKDYSGDEKY